MNQELANIIKIYSTGSHKELSNYLIGKSKDTLIGTLVDLLTMYINDKNSSTIREFITVTFAGYNHKEGKIGYNGFKQDAFVSGRTIKCEAKPKNVDTHSIPLRKLNGGGNFTDYTFERLEKDKREKDLNMLVSGFVDGRLVYILEFPFGFSDFIKNLEKKLYHRFGEGKRTSGQFLRGANFNYKHFIKYSELKIVYLLAKDKLEEFKPYIVKDFYKFLEGKANVPKQLLE
ncbi:MAG TPA: hypothetical protein ACFYD5_03515 [Candidatus Tripitaka sp. YC43]